MEREHIQHAVAHVMPHSATGDASLLHTLISFWSSLRIKKYANKPTLFGSHHEKEHFNAPYSHTQ